MADEEHVRRLKQGITEWNAWRRDNRTIHPDLNGADLSGADLSRADLRGAHLIRADLRGANLHLANLYAANLNFAILSSAVLAGTNLSSALLVGADLVEANLGEGTNLTEAMLGETVLGNVDLTSVIGLETCIHYAPSTIDHRTLQKSKPLPLAFVTWIMGRGSRGWNATCGWPSVPIGGKTTMLRPGMRRAAAASASIAPTRKISPARTACTTAIAVWLSSTTRLNTAGLRMQNVSSASCLCCNAYLRHSGRLKLLRNSWR
jgi:hypothetical protein